MVNTKPAARKTAPPSSNSHSNKAGHGAHGLPILIEDDDDDSNSVHTMSPTTESASKRPQRPDTKAAGVAGNSARNDNDEDSDTSTARAQNGAQPTIGKRKQGDGHGEPAESNKRRKSLLVTSLQKQTRMASSSPVLPSSRSFDRRTRQQLTRTSVSVDGDEAAVQLRSDQAANYREVSEDSRKNRKVNSVRLDTHHFITRKGKERVLDQPVPLTLANNGVNSRKGVPTSYVSDPNVDNDDSATGIHNVEVVDLTQDDSEYDDGKGNASCGESCERTQEDRVGEAETRRVAGASQGPRAVNNKPSGRTMATNSTPEPTSELPYIQPVLNVSQYTVHNVTRPSGGQAIVSEIQSYPATSHRSGPIQRGGSISRTVRRLLDQ